jgi:hypothetical protein
MLFVPKILCKYLRRYITPFNVTTTIGSGVGGTFSFANTSGRIKLPLPSNNFLFVHHILLDPVHPSLRSLLSSKFRTLSKILLI